MKSYGIWIAMVLALGASLGCGSTGTPGVSGTVTLSPDILIKPQTATKIFVGAYGAEQLRQLDGWPERWADAKFSQTIDNLTPKDYDYSFITGSGERLYIFAFLDQNGTDDGGSAEPNAIDIGGEIVKDVIGSYGPKPVVPLDDMLKDVNVELNIEIEP